MSSFSIRYAQRSSRRQAIELPNGQLPGAARELSGNFDYLGG